MNAVNRRINLFLMCLTSPYPFESEKRFQIIWILIIKLPKRYKLINLSLITYSVWAIENICLTWGHFGLMAGKSHRQYTDKTFFWLATAVCGLRNRRIRFIISVSWETFSKYIFILICCCEVNWMLLWCL